MHGGISPKILKIGWSTNKINYNCRPFYDMSEHPEKFTDTTVLAFFDEDNISPFWYRGYFTEPKASQGLVDSTLAFYQCRQIIVGHDIIDNVGTFYQDKVYGIDVNEHLGNTQALLIESGKFYKVDRIGNKILLRQQIICPNCLLTSWYPDAIRKKTYNWPRGLTKFQTVARSFRSARHPIKTISENMAIYAGTYSAVLPGGQHFILTQDPGLINYVLRENHTNYHKSELTSKREEGFLEMDCFFPTVPTGCGKGG